MWRPTLFGLARRLSAHTLRTPPLRALPLLALASLALGCNTARHPAVPMVRGEATKDLTCPQRQIDVQPLMGGRYRATGCGRSAVYGSACEQLACTVAREGKEPTPWRGRPDPGTAEADR